MQSRIGQRRSYAAGAKGCKNDTVAATAPKHAIFGNQPKASTDKVRKVEPWEGTREPAID